MDFSNKNQTTKADGTDKNTVNVFYFLKTPFKIKLDHLVQKQELTETHTLTNCNLTPILSLITIFEIKSPLFAIGFVITRIFPNPFPPK